MDIFHRSGSEIMMQPNQRLEDLEQRFSQMESRLKDTPEKEAISILHAMIQENRRQLPAKAAPAGETGASLEYVANLYKSAPGMQGAAENEGLPIGSPAPDFTLPDAQGQPVSLSDFRGKHVVLVFYPLDWSPACSDQLSLYQVLRATDGFSERALYILNPQGIIRFRNISPEIHMIPDIYELFAQLEKLKG